MRPSRPVALVAALWLAALAGCVATRPFLDARGGVVPASIATMETVRIGGIDRTG